MKPIVWNDAGYRHPTGGPFQGGYPADNGYGHEEWNHRPDLIVEHDGRPMKIFHSERVSKPDIVFDGQPITLHLYASRGGRQAIMSTARNCISLHEDLAGRLAIVEKLPAIRELWEDAWRLPFVQKGSDKRTFRNKWFEKDASWIPTWLCPIEDFFAWERPIIVDGHAIKGRRFGTRYKTSELLNADQASALDDFLPFSDQSERSEEADVEVINARDLPATTRKSLIDARRGQGKFRSDLMRRWNGKCAVTGCGLSEVLRASHIKAWHESSDRERLSPENGLLLIATLDALFDRHLISFSDDGKMLISPRIGSEERQLLSLTPDVQIEVPSKMKRYLKQHRLQFDDVGQRKSVHSSSTTPF
ncbi:HNH endonuclease [Aurantimonas litoralis]|nr:HNH endonuclease [Aurantimonas litoralis]